MIRHTVLFTLSSPDSAIRHEQTAEIRRLLEALVGVVPGLHALTLHEDLGLIESNAHLVLVTEHDDREALEAYQAHPQHHAAGAYIRSVISGRTVVDAEV